MVKGWTEQIPILLQEYEELFFAWELSKFFFFVRSPKTQEQDERGRGNFSHTTGTFKAKTRGTKALLKRAVSDESLLELSNVAQPLWNINWQFWALKHFHMLGPSLDINGYFWQKKNWTLSFPTHSLDFGKLILKRTKKSFACERPKKDYDENEILFPTSILKTKQGRNGISLGSKLILFRVRWAFRSNPSRGKAWAHILGLLKMKWSMLFSLERVSIFPSVKCLERWAGLFFHCFCLRGSCMEKFNPDNRYLSSLDQCWMILEEGRLVEDRCLKCRRRSWGSWIMGFKCVQFEGLLDYSCWVFHDEGTNKSWGAQEQLENQFDRMIRSMETS